MAEHEYKHEASGALYTALENQYAAMHGGAMPPAAEAHVIRDVCDMEDMKIDFRADVARRSVIESCTQGRQSFRRENKSVGMIAKLSAEQAKLLKTIRLIATGRADVGEDGESDDDESFDEY